MSRGFGALGAWGFRVSLSGTKAQVILDMTRAIISSLVSAPELCCFNFVWAVLILIEPTLGYAPLRAIPAHHGESYLRRDISSYMMAYASLRATEASGTCLAKRRSLYVFSRIDIAGCVKKF